MPLGVPVSFAVFELCNYILLSLCAWHALQQGSLRRARLIELGTGVLYGLTLETLTIVQFHAYQYGRFLIMFGPVPLAIGVGGLVSPTAISMRGLSCCVRLQPCSGWRAHVRLSPDGRGRWRH